MVHYSKILILLFLLVATINVFAVDLNIAFPNGSFETGTLSDWNIDSYKGSGAADAAFQVIDFNYYVVDDNRQDFGNGSCAPCGTRVTIVPLINTESSTSGSYSTDTNMYNTGGGRLGSATYVLSPVTGTLKTNDIVFFDFKFDRLAISTSDFYVDAMIVGNGHFYQLTNATDTNGSAPQNCSAPFGVADTITTATSAGGAQKFLLDTNWHTYWIKLACTSDVNVSSVRFQFTRNGTNNAGNVVPFEVSFRTDNWRYQRNVVVTLINSITEPPQPVVTGSNFNIQVGVTQDFNGDNVPDANVRISFNNGAFTQATYNSSTQKYSATFTAPSSSGDYNYAVDTNKTGGYVADYDQGFIAVSKPEFKYLTFTPIENIASWHYGSIDIFPTDESKQIIFRVDSNSASAETPTYVIHNSLTDGKQYFIYTSSDGNNYVFNDSLTFGNTVSTPIQKIWSDANNAYDYNFVDSLSAAETKYYKLTYRNPFQYYLSIYQDANWFSQLEPFVNDVNTFSVDQYSVSSFSNIRNVFLQYVPQLLGGTAGAYDLQFTAWADSTVTMAVGSTINGTDSTQNITLTTAPRRFSVNINSSNFNTQAIMKTNVSTSATVYIRDYAIVARQYFTKRLTLNKSNGDDLDLILLGGFSHQYLQEGNPFKINSEAYDREGILDILQVQGYLDSNATNNRVANFIYSVYDSNDTGDKAERTITFDRIINPIIDINGNALNPNPPRNVIVKAILTDSNGFAIAEQSQAITFLQYPYFPTDLFLNFFPTEKRKGKNPQGIIDLQVAKPETLEGLDIRIFSDGNTITNPTYRTQIYKDRDFTCVGTTCSFQFKIPDFIFQDANATTIAIIALMNTEVEDLNNYLVRTDRIIQLSDITYSVAKIYQQIQRVDREYHNTEEIPLVLILQDTEADNLKSSVDVYLTLQNCDANTGTIHCVPQNTKFKPTGFLYDPRANLNYYFFRQLYLLDNGSLLPDGNFIRFRATVTDRTGIRATSTPVLADKCLDANYDFDVFNPASLGAYITGALQNLTAQFTGCNTPQYNVVTTSTNSTQEVLIGINNARTVQSPTQLFFVCLAPDSNNVVGKPLEADIVCALGYQATESPIDSFRFRVGNNFSDYSVKGSTKQYKEFNIPYELISNNDLIMLNQELDARFDTSINTVGDMVRAGFNQAIPPSANFSNGRDTQLIVPFGNIDYNFSNALSPNNITGIMFVTLHGVPVTNIYDYQGNFSLKDIASANKSAFLDYLSSKNVKVPQKESTLDVVTTSFSSPFTVTDSQGSIVINEKASKNTTAPPKDGNWQNTPAYQLVPSVLLFNISETMFFANQSQHSDFSVVVQILNVFNENATAIIANLQADPIGWFTGWLLRNIILIAIVAGCAFIFAAIYAKFGGGQGNGNGSGN